MTNRLPIAQAYAGQEGRVFQVVAQTACGRRFHHPHDFSTLAKAEAMAVKVQAVGSIDEPIWLEGYPVYGSEASQRELAEASFYGQALSRGHCHMDDVPDCYRALL